MLEDSPDSKINQVDNRSKKKALITVVILAALLGGLYNLFVYGNKIVDPTETAWMMTGADRAQHFLGWHVFRNEAWSFPPGKMSSIENPSGASIGYTDSIPVVAFILKIFTSILPENFQYFGIWLLLCFCLQGLFGALLMRNVSDNHIIQLVGAAFFIVSPILTIRLNHPALCCHWMLLAGLWLYFRKWKSYSPLTFVSRWGLLVLLVAAMHPYMAFMLLGLAFAFYLRLWRVERKIRLRKGVLDFSSLAFLTFLVWWISGYFEIGSLGSSYGSFGYGHFSLNLAAPFNPVGWANSLWAGKWSVFQKSLPAATRGQVDGFNYLGMGALALGLVVIVILTYRPPSKAAVKSLFPLGLVCFCFSLLAISHKVTFSKYTVVELKLPDYVLGAISPFRASGRFFWPVYYCILFLLFAFLVRRLKRKTCIVILSLGLVLQIVDFSGIYKAFDTVRHPPGKWESPLQSEAWTELAEKYEKIVLVPPRRCSEEEVAPYEPFAYLAANHGMTTNSFYLARFNFNATSQYCNRLISEIKNGIIDPRAVYVLSDKYLGILKGTARVPIRCMTIDGLNVCVAE